MGRGGMARQKWRAPLYAKAGTLRLGASPARNSGNRRQCSRACARGGQSAWRAHRVDEPDIVVLVQLSRRMGWARVGGWVGGHGATADLSLRTQLHVRMPLSLTGYLSVRIWRLKAAICWFWSPTMRLYKSSAPRGRACAAVLALGGGVQDAAACAHMQARKLRAPTRCVQAVTQKYPAPLSDPVSRWKASLALASSMQPCFIRCCTKAKRCALL